MLNYIYRDVVNVNFSQATRCTLSIAINSAFVCSRALLFGEINFIQTLLQLIETKKFLSLLLSQIDHYLLVTFNQPVKKKNAKLTQ